MIDHAPSTISLPSASAGKITLYSIELALLIDEDDQTEQQKRYIYLSDFHLRAGYSVFVRRFSEQREGARGSGKATRYHAQAPTDMKTFLTDTEPARCQAFKAPSTRRELGMNTANSVNSWRASQTDVSITVQHVPTAYNIYNDLPDLISAQQLTTSKDTEQLRAICHRHICLPRYATRSTKRTKNACPPDQSIHPTSSMRRMASICHQVIAEKRSPAVACQVIDDHPAGATITPFTLHVRAVNAVTGRRSGHRQYRRPDYSVLRAG